MISFFLSMYKRKLILIKLTLLRTMFQRKVNLFFLLLTIIVLVIISASAENSYEELEDFHLEVNLEDYFYNDKK